MRIRIPELVALVAFTVFTVTMSIDAMLPALGVIASSLRVSRENDRQLVLMMFFGGLIVVQLVLDPAEVAELDKVSALPAEYPGWVLEFLRNQGRAPKNAR